MGGRRCRLPRRTREAALELTVSYVSDRAAFDSDARRAGPRPATARGRRDQDPRRGAASEDAPDESALRHAGPAVADACDACQQVTGAIGYTLEYPLHRFSQRARALAAWNDALLDEEPTVSLFR